MWNFLLSFFAFVGFQVTLMVTYHEWSDAVSENQRRLPNVMIRALILMTTEAIIYFQMAIQLLDLVRKSFERHPAETIIWYLFSVGVAASGVLNLVFGVVWLAQMRRVLLDFMDLYDTFRPTASADLEAGGDILVGDRIPSSDETTPLREEFPSPDPLTLVMDPAFRNPMYAGMPTAEDRERLAIAERKRNRPQVLLSDDGSSSSGSDFGPLYCDPYSEGGYSSTTEEECSDVEVGYSTV